MPRKKKEETKAEPKQKQTTKKKFVLEPNAIEGDIIELALYEDIPEKGDVPVVQTRYRVRKGEKIFGEPIDLFEGIIHYAYICNYEYGRDFLYLTVKLGKKEPYTIRILAKDSGRSYGPFGDDFDCINWDYAYVDEDGEYYTDDEVEEYDMDDQDEE